MIGLYILFVGVLYVLVALSTSYWLSRFPERQKTKTWTQILTVLVFALIPTWDIAPGKLYFKYLCNTEGGVRVYQKAELPAEYWQDDGDPRSKLKKTGPADYEYTIGKEYFMVSTEKQTHSDLFHIDKHGYIVKSRETGELLGQYTFFRYWGGWLINSTGLHRSAERCPKNNFLEKIFIRKD